MQYLITQKVIEVNAATCMTEQTGDIMTRWTAASDGRKEEVEDRQPERGEEFDGLTEGRGIKVTKNRGGARGGRGERETEREREGGGEGG